MTKDKEKRIADFFFELGTMRKVLRIHRQTLMTDDMSDNIATHSYRVAMIGWFLAKEEGVDLYKTVMMCLLHDIAEVRSGDHNWVHKRYVKIFEGEIKDEQLGSLPYSDLKEIADEYDERRSKEAIVAKDADLLDQILLLREYEWQGNQEAISWLKGKATGERSGAEAKLDTLQTDSAKRIGKEIYRSAPSDWFADLMTSKNR